MYFPIRWPRFLDTGSDCSVVHICSDYNRALFGLLTEDSLSIWFEKLSLRLAYVVRSAESISKYGHNEKLLWRQDSSMVAIVTSKSHILFYNLDPDYFTRTLYEQVDSKVTNLRRISAELFVKDKIFAVNLTYTSHVYVPGTISSVLSFRDELVVACASGHLLRISWVDFSVLHDLTIDLNEVPFTTEVCAFGQNIGNSTYEVIDLQYLPLIGSLSIVFKNGKCGVLMATTNKFDPKDVHGVWISDVKDATCTAVNHRYRLLAFGLKSSVGMVYYLDDLTGTFQLSHKLCLSDKDFPEVRSVAGPVACMQWAPDSAAVAVAWEKSGVALWSVFGSLLMCTLNWDSGASISKKNLFKVNSMYWGCEGYNLWMSTASTDEDGTSRNKVALMNFVKSSSTVNPGPQSGQDRILLQGADCVMISSKSDLTSNSSPAARAPPSFADSGGNSEARCSYNKHWICECVPHTYLSANWPIRYSALDSTANYVAIAGKGGFAHCSLSSKKWKFFGNESQEQDFIVTGGLLWWKSFIVLGCINLRDSSQSNEIRVYPRDCKLDNEFVRVCTTPAQVLQLSACDDKLLAFFADSRLFIYRFQPLSAGTASGVQLIEVEHLDITTVIPHCLCVVSATLSVLSIGSLPPWPGKRAESILLNVCGRLMLLQHDPARRQSVAGAQGQYSTPTVLASGVENVWLCNTHDPSMPHLTQALWIACGAHGMQVWLPLFPSDHDKMRATHNFMSKRIMLAIKVNIYPLAVLFRQAVVLGAESDTALCVVDDTFPLCVVTKSSEVYLHLILNKLLFRNLGYHAWEIAHSCQSLPYFNHSLELLLHEVLEEEAMSSEPIPDALLPRVIDFIREFPVFLKTVVQCARKTELALWPHLFAAVGNPKDLFQECILQGQLETATSYLLVLQNLEVAMVSRQHATLLLGAALDAAKWHLAKDLMRFLKAIDPSDVESPPRASLVLGPPTKMGVVACPTEEDLATLVGLSTTIPRPRLPSKTDEGVSAIPTHHGSIPATPSAPSPSGVLQRGISVPSTSSNPPMSAATMINSVIGREDQETVNEVFIEVILNRHARKLLQAGQLHKLGAFSAQLDFDLVTFLKREKSRNGTVDDFVGTLKALHQDFEWPYPMTHAVIASNLLSGHSSWEGSSSGGASVPATPAGDVASLVLADRLLKDSLRNGSLASDSGFADHSIDATLQPQVPSRDRESISSASDGGSWCNNSVEDLSGSRNDAALGLPPPNAQPYNATDRNSAAAQICYIEQVLAEQGIDHFVFLLACLLTDCGKLVSLCSASEELKRALVTLDAWAAKECAGYSVLFQAVLCQLEGGVSQKQKSPRTPFLKRTPLTLAPQLDEELSVSLNDFDSKCTIRTNPMDVMAPHGDSSTLNDVRGASSRSAPATPKDSAPPHHKGDPYLSSNPADALVSPSHDPNDHESGCRVS